MPKNDWTVLLGFLRQSWLTFEGVAVFEEQLTDELRRLNEAIEGQLNQPSLPRCKFADQFSNFEVSDAIEAVVLLCGTEKMATFVSCLVQFVTPLQTTTFALILDKGNQLLNTFRTLLCLHWKV